MAVLQWHKVYTLGEDELQIAPVVALIWSLNHGCMGLSTVDLVFTGACLSTNLDKVSLNAAVRLSRSSGGNLTRSESFNSARNRS